MNLAKVLGHATSTVKHSSMDGWRLLVVQMIDAAGGPDAEPLLAIDNMGGRKGDTVLLTSDGNAVADMLGRKDSPVRWAVLGIAD
ncbi:MAG: EutN/CcmL family microcompartment protein [Planctomycetota bacterium]|nr:EutN/CcmL family microcompartment protein [Planctomycetaceae bacterium]MDQ3329914.1 EutN/CcmL family microcompartment protein [Planctomycetota bacterium]